MSLLHEGQLLRETWEVERMVGEGAFAEVYRVRHRFLGRQAMKIFKAVGMSVRELDELLAEARLLSRLGHRNLIRVFDANTAELEFGLCGFFTMEYVTGGNLEQFWRAQGNQRSAVSTAVDIIRQVCAGLAVAHGEWPPVLHRDIKPQNILVEQPVEGLRVRVSDFGLARHANPLTLQASARGTLAYQAPETLHDWKSASRTSDVWAVGCTLYLLLTGRFPYPEVLNPQTLRQIGRTPLILPSSLNAQVDSECDAIVAKALSLNPQTRYQHAQELLDALTGSLDKSKRPSLAHEPTRSASGAMVPESGSRDGGSATRGRGPGVDPTAGPATKGHHDARSRLPEALVA